MRTSFGFHMTLVLALGLASAASSAEPCRMSVNIPGDDEDDNETTTTLLTNCASVSSQVSIQSNATGRFQLVSESDQGTLDSARTANTDAVSFGTDYTGSAAAAVTPGTIHAVANAHGHVFNDGVNPAVRATVDARANTELIDSITVTVPSLALGTTGILHVLVGVDAQFGVFTDTPNFPLSASIQAALFTDASHDLTGDSLRSVFDLSSFQLGGGFFFNARANGVELFQEGRNPPPPALSGIFPVDVAFINGMPVLMRITAEVRARADTEFLANRAPPGSTGDVAALFGDSFHWGGIDSVSIGGAPISEFSVNSASGIDYAKSFIDPVPLPASFWLFLVSTFAAVRRRRALIVEPTPGS